MDLSRVDFEEEIRVQCVYKDHKDYQLSLDFSFSWMEDHSVPLSPVPSNITPIDVEMEADDDSAVHYRWDTSKTSSTTQAASKYLTARGWRCPLCMVPWDYGNFSRLREHVASTHEPVLVRLAGPKKVDIGWKWEQQEWLEWEKANWKRRSVFFDLLEHSPDLEDADASDEEAEEVEDEEEEEELEEEDESEDEVLPVSKRPRLQGPLTIGAARATARKKQPTRPGGRGSADSDEVPLARAPAAAAKKAKATAATPRTPAKTPSRAGSAKANGRKDGRTDADALADLLANPAIRTYTAKSKGNPYENDATMTATASSRKGAKASSGSSKTPSISSRLDPKSLATKLKDLDAIWDGGAFAHQLQERDEVSFMRCW